MRPTCCTALLLATALLQGQQRPAFEVVSIRPAPAITPVEAMRARLSRVTVSWSRATLGYQSLAELILRAYRLEAYQLVAPAWMNTTRFDVAARLPETASPDQFPEMLQTMLEARFRLSAHHDTRQLSVYMLVVGPQGVKLKPRPADYQRVQGDYWQPRKFESLVRYLTLRLDRPVLDRTTLQGEYLINLEQVAATFAPRAAALRAQLEGQDLPHLPSDPVGPETFRLMEQWGLKLESRKVPVPVLVVDSAEKAPTEN